MEARIHDGDDKVCPFDKDRNSIAVDVQNWTKHFDRRLLRCQSFDIYGNTGKYGSATKEYILIGDGQFSPHNMETMLDSRASSQMLYTWQTWFSCSGKQNVTKHLKPERTKQINLTYKTYKLGFCKHVLHLDYYRLFIVKRYFLHHKEQQANFCSTPDG